MATLDPNIALSYRFPQIDTPVQQYQNAFRLQQAQMDLAEARRTQALRDQYHQQRQSMGDNPTHQQMLDLDLRSGLMQPHQRATLLQGEQNRLMQIEAQKQWKVSQLNQKHMLDMLKLDQAERMGVDKNITARIRAISEAAHRNNLGRAMASRAAYNEGTEMQVQEVDVGALLTQALQGMPQVQQQQPQAPQMAPPQPATQGLPSFQQARAAYVPGRPFTQQIDPASVPDAEMQKPVVDTAMPQPAISAPPAPQPMPVAGDAANLDARDLRARQLPVGQGVPAVRAQAEAQAAASEAPPSQAILKAPEMPPEIARIPRERAKWLQTQGAIQAREAARGSRLQIGGPNQLSEADKDYYAAYVMLNGRMPVGLSRIGPEAIQSIMSRVSERATKMGMKPEDFAMAGPVVRTKLGALMQFEKQVNAIQAYEGMLVKNIDILKELSEKVPRTKSPWLNRPLNEIKRGAAGDEDMAEYLFQIQTVATEVARVLNNPNLTGQLTDTAKRELDHVLDGRLNHAQLMRVLDRAKADAQNRSKSLDEQKDKVIREIRSFGGTSPTAPTAPAATGQWRVVR